MRSHTFHVSPSTFSILELCMMYEKETTFCISCIKNYYVLSIINCHFPYFRVFIKFRIITLVNYNHYYYLNLILNEVFIKYSTYCIRFCGNTAMDSSIVLLQFHFVFNSASIALSRSEEFVIDLNKNRMTRSTICKSAPITRWLLHQ